MIEGHAIEGDLRHQEADSASGIVAALRDSLRVADVDGTHRITSRISPGHRVDAEELDNSYVQTGLFQSLSADGGGKALPGIHESSRKRPSLREVLPLYQNDPVLGELDYRVYGQTGRGWTQLSSLIRFSCRRPSADGNTTAHFSYYYS